MFLNRTTLIVNSLPGYLTRGSNGQQHLPSTAKAWGLRSAHTLIGFTGQEPK